MVTKLDGVFLIKPKVFYDERGFFLETYKKSVFAEHGITVGFDQDNHSQSTHGVLRGLHYQINPSAQGKLVRCIRGAVFDVAVDIRHNSPTFGQWVGYELSEENKHMLYIPVGFAHGFLTLSKCAELAYKTTHEYVAKDDRGILYNDPAINIAWPEIDAPYVLSDKDKQQPLLALAEINFYQ